ncbi:integrase [Agrobacterium salinitolerans]|nr:integrase [Agrobacterium salinitolerans]PNQ22591.1 integrase [Rhizobium sp. YIC5082]
MLVTGIQPTRVRVAERLPQPKDLGWLDPCDKRRDEGGDRYGFTKP